MFSKLARKIDAEEMVRVALSRFGQFNQDGCLVPAWQRRTSPLDSTQKIRRSASRGAVRLLLDPGLMAGHGRMASLLCSGPLPFEANPGGGDVIRLFPG
jgi:hypothetical protein